MGSIAHKIAAQIVPVLSSEWAGVTHKIDTQIVPVLSSEWAGVTHKIDAQIILVLVGRRYSQDCYTLFQEVT